MGDDDIMAYRYGGYGYPYGYARGAPGFYGSLRLSDELKQEEDFLGARRQLYGDLRTAEAAEAQAAEKLFQDQRNAEVRTAAAADAKALFERAAQAAQRAEEARNAEVAAAEKK